MTKSKYTYIIQYKSENGHDSVYAYSSRKACYEMNAEELGWSYDKIKRHPWAKEPLISRDGTVVMHRTDPIMSMGDYRRFIEAALSVDMEETISDGFGSEWSAWCPECRNTTMQVVGPGKVQCSDCG